MQAQGEMKLYIIFFISVHIVTHAYWGFANVELLKNVTVKTLDIQLCTKQFDLNFLYKPN